MKERILENWDQILKALETDYGVSQIIADTWIRNLSIYNIQNKKIYFYVDERLGEHGVDYIHSKGYDVYLLSALREFFGDSEIDIVIDQKVNYEKEEVSSHSTESHNASQAYYDAIQRSNLNSKYTFDNFIVGDGNKHAHATCIAVADEPGQDNFNPLFLYGKSGLGKTHLIQSIAHYILQHDPSKNVLYVPSETFTNEIIGAIQKNKTEEFRQKYRKIDVLIIDDIQEIIGKDRTQTEFFSTFNFLYEAKKQIIISSDRPPREFKELDERLRSRFDWGVPIDIHEPDYETRMAILKNKADLMGLMNIDEHILQFIATNIVSNVRELEGALNKINIYAKLSNQNITEDLAKEALKDMISNETEVSITPEVIINVVSEHTEISVADIMSTKRSKDIATARQLVMYLCRNLTDKSLQAIGEAVGGKDHATVCNGIKRIDDRMKEDSEFNQTVHVIINKLNPDSMKKNFQ